MHDAKWWWTELSEATDFKAQLNSIIKKRHLATRAFGSGRMFIVNCRCFRIGAVSMIAIYLLSTHFMLVEGHRIICACAMSSLPDLFILLYGIRNNCTFPGHCNGAFYELATIASQSIEFNYNILLFYYILILYLRYIWVFESLHRYRTSCSRAASLGDLWLFIGYFRSNISCSIRECIRIEFIAVQGNKKECDVGTFVSGARHQELGTKRRGWNDWINICYHSSFTFQIYVTINQLYLSR